jgi:hypothetical protein
MESTKINGLIMEQGDRKQIAFDLSQKALAVHYPRPTRAHVPKKRTKNPEQKTRSDDMYSTVITFKPDIPDDVFYSLRTTCEKAFDNHAGKATCKIDAPNRLIFEGDGALYCCLHLGNISLYKTTGFKDAVKTWEWVDEEPGESCDVLETLATPVY